MDVHEYFRLREEQATEIISKVKKAVTEWRIIASKYGISRREQDLKALAFSKAEI